MAHSATSRVPSEPLGPKQLDAWLALNARHDPADLPLLLPTLVQHRQLKPLHQSVRALGERPRDPAIAAALVELMGMERLKSASSHEMWADVAATIAYHAGPETLELLDQRQAGQEYYFRELCNALLATLPGQLKPRPAVDVEQRLEAAARELSRGQASRALDELLAVWATHPTPELGQAIRGISALLEREHQALPVKPFDEAQQAWLALAGGGDTSQVPRLLAQFDQCLVAALEERLMVLANLPPDPRIASALLDFVKRGTAALARWTRVDGGLLQHAGGLHAPALAELSQKSYRMQVVQRFLQARHGERALALPAPSAALALILEKVGQKRSALTSDQALLDQILENPDDDPARLVYADWLMQREDPRGEFILLQIQQRGEASSRKRERELEKQYAKAWCGQLAQVAVAFSYKRGFLAACRVNAVSPQALATAIDDPLWTTLERIELDGHPDIVGFERPGLRALKQLTGVRPAQALALAAAPAPTRIQRLGLKLFEQQRGHENETERLPELVKGLVASQALPSLDELELQLVPRAQYDYRRTIAELSPLWQSPLGQRIRKFSLLVDSHVDDPAYPCMVADWLRELRQRKPDLVGISVRGHLKSGLQWSFNFTPGKSAWLGCLRGKLSRPSHYPTAGCLLTLQALLEPIDRESLESMALKGRNLKPAAAAEVEDFERFLQARFEHVVVKFESGSPTAVWSQLTVQCC